MQFRCPLLLLTAAGFLSTLAACSGMDMQKDAEFKQMSVSESVRVPAGNLVAMETVGVGQLTFECRAKTGMAGQYEWALAGPDANLMDRSGKQVGKYYGPPATWESMDGSKLTGTPVAVAPAASEGNLSYQLVKADPAIGMGAMQNLTYVQRIATKGGAAPKSDCSATTMGQKQVVNYQADYVFYKAM